MDLNTESITRYYTAMATPGDRDQKPLDVRTKDRERLPPGQKETVKWPVLHFGNVPRVDVRRWSFRVFGEVERPYELTWDEFVALPRAEVLCDIHCVTHWSRYDNVFGGVSVTQLLERAGVRPTATHALVHAEQDFTTNLPLDDLLREANLVATHHGGAPLSPEHGGPARLVVPHLYFWKSAKWVRGIELMAGDFPGFWEQNGYHMHGDPWTEERFGRPDPVRMRRGGSK
jgi:DMSO/TMAO reductase YedYZ molybdopterin-dependent catalytic subunit